MQPHLRESAATGWRWVIAGKREQLRLVKLRGSRSILGTGTAQGSWGQRSKICLRQRSKKRGWALLLKDGGGVDGSCWQAGSPSSCYAYRFFHLLFSCSPHCAATPPPLPMTVAGGFKLNFSENCQSGSTSHFGRWWRCWKIFKTSVVRCCENVSPPLRFSFFFLRQLKLLEREKFQPYKIQKHWSKMYLDHSNTRFGRNKALCNLYYM